MATPDPSGCCPDNLALELVDATNPPGQPRLRRRVGTYSRFRERLEAELSLHTPTRGLTTREPDDFAIALLHGWATVADNVTFYTERIANENYVGTATQRRSMNELARLIGRTLQPGMAAEADLAFTMDSTPGAPDRLELGIGAAVQSDPEPGGEPAIYETIESRELRPAWNRLRARSTLPTLVFGTGTPRLHLAGTATGVRVGDMIAYAAGAAGKPVVAAVTSVETVDAVAPVPDEAGRPARTVIELDDLSQVDTGLNGNDLLSNPGSVPPLTGVAAWLNGRTITASVLAAEAEERRVHLADVEASLSGSEPTAGFVTVFRLSAALFGAAAPASASLAAALESELIGLDDDDLTEALNGVSLADVFTWESDTAANIPSSKEILLDTGYPVVAPGSFVALTTSTKGAVYRVNKASVGGYAAGGVSGKTTRLELSSGTAQGDFPIRSTAVAAQSERLDLTPRPWPGLVLFNSVKLEKLVLGLTPGRTVVVSGAAEADPERMVHHVTELAEVTHDFEDRITTLTLATSVPESLIRESVTVNANVVKASHGLTRSDVLGSGDGRRQFQKFSLAEEPLTFLSAATSLGRITTLRVFVDDLEWSEVDQLPGHDADERIFVTRSTEGGTIVQFGDGVTGARLPTGIANVRAAYRVGAGAAGRVGANRLTTLASRPAGLAGVTNPTGSEGGAEPETADHARSNVAVQVRTLGRVVSLRDYEDFARSFSGVAKARATWGRSGRRRGIIVTVAGDDGDAIVPGTPIHDSLVEAFATAGDALVPVHLVDHRPRTFRVTADLRIQSDFQRDLVHAGVNRTVRARFAFARRGLGESIYASEILETMHGVAGVAAADLTVFGVVTGAGTVSGVPDVLHASAPQPGLLLSGAATSTGAELLTIESRSILLGDLP